MANARTVAGCTFIKEDRALTPGASKYTHAHATRRVIGRIVAGIALAWATGAVAAPASGLYFHAPPLGDFIRQWISERAYASGGIVARDDDDYTTGLLRDPTSIYSNLMNDPTRWSQDMGDPATARRAQAMLAYRQGIAITDVSVQRMLAWDLGLTKALPGLQGFRLTGFSGNEAAEASLSKAGVTPTIFDKALALFGPGHDAVAANYAVAVQVLVEKALATSDQGQRSAGLRSDVAERFLRAATLDDVSAEDLHYLARTLQGELSAWTAGGKSIFDKRELPTPLRIARVAAAYRDLRSYTWNPCGAGGTARADLTTLHALVFDTPLCLSDTLDRYVYAWYRNRLRQQSLPSFPGMAPVESPRLRKAIASLRYARPLWLGAYADHAQDAASRSEVVEYMAATSLADGGDLDTRLHPLTARGITFLCGVPRP